MVGLMVAVAGVAGCTRTVFIHECDKEHYGKIGIPAELDCNPAGTILPERNLTPTPTTIFDPDRKPRYITLRECLAIALEQGNVGSQSALFPGAAPGQPVSFQGRLSPPRTTSACWPSTRPSPRPTSRRPCPGSTPAGSPA